MRGIGVCCDTKSDAAQSTYNTNKEKRKEKKERDREKKRRERGERRTLGFAPKALFGISTKH